MAFWQIALAIWFGLYALFALTNVAVKQGEVIMGVLAAIVCVLLFVGDRSWRRSPPAP